MRACARTHTHTPVQCKFGPNSRIIFIDKKVNKPGKVLIRTANGGKGRTCPLCNLCKCACHANQTSVFKDIFYLIITGKCTE